LGEAHVGLPVGNHDPQHLVSKLRKVGRPRHYMPPVRDTVKDGYLNIGGQRDDTKSGIVYSIRDEIFDLKVPRYSAKWGSCDGDV